VKVSLVLINARRNPDQVDLHSAYQLAPACQDRHDIRVPEPVYRVAVAPADDGHSRRSPCSRDGPQGELDRVTVAGEQPPSSGDACNWLEDYGITVAVLGHAGR